MIATCKHCGAPLDLKASARKVKCNYCNQVNQVRSMETVLPQTPSNWQPPPVWTPPPQLHFPQPTLQYHRVSSAAPLLIVILSGGGVAVVGVLVAVFALIGAGATTVKVTHTSSPPMPGIPVDTSGWGSTTVDGKLICTSGTKTASNQKLETVVASGHCQLTLTGCTIGGNPGIVANGDAKVSMSGGSIRPNGPIAIVASGNAVVELSGVNMSGQVIEQGNAKVVR
jgi:LSD1 subclass zinc finger protein